MDPEDKRPRGDNKSPRGGAENQHMVRRRGQAVVGVGSEGYQKVPGQAGPRGPAVTGNGVSHRTD